MAKGIPTKAKVGTPEKSVSIDTATYFLGTRMEKAGMLKRGHALMLSAALSSTTKATVRGANRSKRK